METGASVEIDPAVVEHESSKSKGPLLHRFETESKVLREQAGSVARKLHMPRQFTDLLLDRSQFLVFQALSNVFILFCTVVVTVGLWGWSVARNETIGITIFCASFQFSNIAACSYQGHLEVRVYIYLSTTYILFGKHCR
jgi:hypothetical protein